MKLGFFPPQPACGPFSMLKTLPPDDWLISSKIDGDRVILRGPHAWTRQGVELSMRGKGRIPLLQLAARLPQDMTFDAEWVQEQKTLYLFDLPDHGGTLDERLTDLGAIVEAVNHPLILNMPVAFCRFEEAYENWKGIAEGVVVKKRKSKYQKCKKPCTIREWLKRRYSFDGAQ